MNKDWIFSDDEYVCGLRAAGVLVKDGKILVQHDKGGSEYALPGGHVRIGETLEDGLIREMMEETGAEVRCTRLLWTEESFWNWNGRRAHTVAFYYLIELCGGSHIPDGEFVSQKDNCDVLIGWLPIGKIPEMTLFPAFLKDEIDHLNDPPKHFVTRD